MEKQAKAQEILQQFNEHTRLGDLRKIAAQIKKDHNLSMELWSSGNFFCAPISHLDYG